MSTLLHLFSFVGLLLVMWQVAHVPAEQCPRVVVCFLLAQCVFNFCAWVAGIFFARTENWYHLVFGLSMLPAIGAAVWLAIEALRGVKMFGMIPVLLILSTALAFRVNKLLFNLDWGYRLMGINGAGMLVSGFFLLVSLQILRDTQWDGLRLLLGIFLMTVGVMTWAAPSYFSRHYHSAVHLNDWLPAFILLIFSICVGYILHGYNPSPALR